MDKNGGQLRINGAKHLELRNLMMELKAQRQMDPKKDADGTEPGMSGNQGGTNMVI